MTPPYTLPRVLGVLVSLPYIVMGIVGVVTGVWLATVVLLPIGIALLVAFHLTINAIARSEVTGSGDPSE